MTILTGSLSYCLPSDVTISTPEVCIAQEGWGSELSLALQESWNSCEDANVEVRCFCVFQGLSPFGGRIAGLRSEIPDVRHTCLKDHAVPRLSEYGLFGFLQVFSRVALFACFCKTLAALPADTMRSGYDAAMEPRRLNALGGASMHRLHYGM